MNPILKLRSWLACACCAAMSAGAAAQAPVSAPPPVRPAFAAPVQAAQALLRERKAAEALARLDEAAALPGLTPYETMVLERTRAAAAQQTGNKGALSRAAEAALATGAVERADQAALVEAIVSVAAETRDHDRVLRWSARHAELGVPSDTVAIARIQSQIATGDEAAAMQALAARAEAAERAGKASPESHLRTLLALQRKAKNAGAGRTLERLSTAYPRPEYWTDLVVEAARDPAVPDRALIELYRLLRLVGGVARLDLGEEMAEMSQRLGQPAEALAVLNEAVTAESKAQGAPSPALVALRERLRRQVAAELADRPAAESAAKAAADGNGLVDLGWAVVAGLPTGAPAAEVRPGTALIEQGVARGGLRRPAEAQLRLAMARIAEGRKDAAVQALAAAADRASTDGLSVPVRLWTLYAKAPPMLPSLP